MSEQTNGMLFQDEEIIPWLAEWHNMPEYIQEDLSPQYSLIVNFACAADVEAFGKLIGQQVQASNGRQLQSVWYPEQGIEHAVDHKRYISEDP